MSEKKREVRVKYTPEDKKLLAALILKYKHNIDNKRRGPTYIQEKELIWDEVTTKYNKNCSTGSRTTEQLKALYYTMKKTKKVVNVTGGGYWRRVGMVSGKNKRLRSTMGRSQDQVEPLKDKKNTSMAFNDDRSSLDPIDYDFDYEEEILIVIEVVDDPPSTSHTTGEDVIDMIEPQPSTSDGKNGKTSNIKTEDGVDDPPSTSHTTGENVIEMIEPQPSTSDGKNGKTSNIKTEENSQTSNIKTEDTRQSPNIQTAQPKPKARVFQNTSSAEAAKKLYYNRQIQCANWTILKLKREIQQMEDKHVLEMEILKIQTAQPIPKASVFQNTSSAEAAKKLYYNIQIQCATLTILKLTREIQQMKDKHDLEMEILRKKLA